MSGSTATPVSITVPGYPISNRVPGVFAVVDPSKANTGTINQRALILGQMTAGGSAAAGMPTQIAGLGDAQAQFGNGSLLAHMVDRYRALDGFGEIWALPMADAASSVAAVGSVAFTGTATAAGAIPLYVNGAKIALPVNSGDTALIIATAAVAAINARVSTSGNHLTYLAAVDGSLASKVNLTALNKGSVGNTGSILLSMGGTANGEGTPGTTNVPGITAVIVLPTGGATDPVIATALANLPAQPFDFICCPYSDATSLNAMQAFLGDAAGRWNWQNELFGHCFTAFNGTFSARTTWATARNDQHMTAIGAFMSPSPAWAWAIDMTAVHAVSVRADPALPVGGLGGGAALNVIAPPLAFADTFSEQNSLLYDGMSTFVVDPSGLVRVQRSITTYQFNPGGAPDNSYLDTCVPFQLMDYIRQVRSLIQSQFNQVKLVADGSRIPVGQAMVTSKTVLYSVIGLYRQMAALGQVQNPDQFAAAAQSQNAGSGVVKLLLPVQLANQLYDVAMNVQFTRP